MRWTKRSLWPLAILGALVLLLADLDWSGGEAQAWGRGGGRGGRGGWGRGAPPPTPGMGGGGSGRDGRNNERKEAQELQRRQERAVRVDLARIEYAKRERQQIWDAEAEERLARALGKVLGSSTD